MSCELLFLLSSFSVPSDLLQRMPVSHCLVQLPGANSQWYIQVPPRSQISLGTNKASKTWPMQAELDRSLHTFAFWHVNTVVWLHGLRSWELRMHLDGFSSKDTDVYVCVSEKASWPKCSPIRTQAARPSESWGGLDHLGNPLFLIRSVCLHIRAQWLVRNVNAWPEMYGLSLSKAQTITKHSS